MKLLDSYKFRCGQEVKNRIVLAPLTNTQSPTTQLSEEEFQWLARRIQGGFGVVTTCATHVMKTAQGWDGELGIFSDDHMPGFQRLAAEGEKYSAKVIPQLFHGGFRCPSRITGVQPTSASRFQLDAPDFEEPRALTGTEIQDIIEHFVTAAERVMRAGLPGVEVHGANGYLFTQFLSPHTNRRQDEWGGSLENRARFLLETVRSIRQKIGADKILGVRISPEDTKLIPQIDIDEMIQVALMLDEAGVDYISLSLWNAFKRPNKYETESTTIVERFRKALPQRTAISASGQIWTPAEANRLMELGADFVVMGACGIANPNWPTRFMEHGFEPTRFPLSREELRARAVSDRFIEYLKRWNFVKEA